MTTTRDIRTELSALLELHGYKPTAYTFATIGEDKGSKLHRSFATRIDNRDYQARQGAACRLCVLSMRVRVLLQRQRNDEPESAYSVDDTTDSLVDLLESFEGTGYASRVDSAESEPHATLGAVEVVTVALAVTMREYRSGDYA